MSGVLLRNEVLNTLVMEQLHRELMAEAEQHIQKAVQEYEKSLREKLGIIVLRIAREYDISHERDTLLIRVKAENLGTNYG